MTATRSVLGVLLIVAVLAGGIPIPAADAQQSPPPAPARPDDRAFETDATIANIHYVPGKAIFCAGSAVVAFGITVLTFGQLYGDANRFVRAGCGGRWVLTSADLRDELRRPDAP